MVRPNHAMLAQTASGRLHDNIEGVQIDKCSPRYEVSLYLALLERRHDDESVVRLDGQREFTVGGQMGDEQKKGKDHRIKKTCHDSCARGGGRLSRQCPACAAGEHRAFRGCPNSYERITSVCYGCFRVMVHKTVLRTSVPLSYWRYLNRIHKFRVASKLF